MARERLEASRPLGDSGLVRRWRCGASERGRGGIYRSGSGVGGGHVAPEWMRVSGGAVAVKEGEGVLQWLVGIRWSGVVA